MPEIVLTIADWIKVIGCACSIGLAVVGFIKFLKFVKVKSNLNKDLKKKKALEAEYNEYLKLRAKYDHKDKEVK